jgi:hypothetical protein
MAGFRIKDGWELLRASYRVAAGGPAHGIGDDTRI